MAARITVLATLLLATGALAAERGPPPGEGGGAPPGGRLNLFVSPSGEPFRGRPGEAYPSAAWFARADADHDGHLTQAEFRADAEAFFARLDTNHDGTVDGFETQDYERSMPEMTPSIRPLMPGEGQDPNLDMGRGRRGGLGGGGGGGGGRGRRGGDGRQGVGLYSFFYDPEPVTAADADFNSRVTLAEARAVADKRFAQLDLLHLGYLTLETLPKTTVQALAERRDKDRQADARRNGPGRGVEPEPRRERLQ